jgi:hypothetical protein
MARLVTQHWHRLAAGRAPDAKLLSLDRRMWSWRDDAEPAPLRLIA